MRIPQFPFPAIPGIPFISKLFQFVAALAFDDSYKSNFWQIFFHLAQLCAVGPHAQLAQPLKQTAICGGGPLLAFACPLSLHIPSFLPSLSPHLLCSGLLSTMPPTQNKLIRKMSPRTFPRLCTTAYTLKTWKVYYTYQGQRGKFTKQCFCTVSGQPPSL
jgi:hypothetical protein